MATKEEAIEHMKRGGAVEHKTDLGKDRYDLRFDVDASTMPYDDDDYTLLPIDSKPVGDLLTPIARGVVEKLRSGEQLSTFEVGVLLTELDRLAPKPVKPLPKWVEELAKEWERASFVVTAAQLREAARKAMEDGNG
jgi:hypothetical protein